MATILNSHDLSAGDVLSTEVVNPNSVRLHWLWAGEQDGYVKMTWQVKDGSANYVTLKDDNRKDVSVTVHAGGDEEGSFSVRNINSSLLKISVVPSDDAVGTLSLFTSVLEVAVTDAAIKAVVDDISDAQTDGSQKTMLVDESGDKLYTSGKPVKKSVEITRPANTTAYTAKDAIGTVAANVAQVDTVTLTGTAPTKQKDTLTLTGASGTADITGAGGLTKEVTFAAAGTEDLTQTAADFVTAFAGDYLAVDITLTSSGADLIFESTTYGQAFTSPVITNTDGDLDGTVDNTTANVVVGEASITGAGGLAKTVTFDTAGGVDLTDTAAAFVSDFAADYLEEGIVLTSSAADLIFTAASAGVPFTSPVITNTVGDLDGTVENTTPNAVIVPIEFTDMCIESGGGGVLMAVKLDTNITAMTAKEVRVWIFSDEPTSIAGDNVAFATAYANKAKLLFFADVIMEAVEGSSDNIVGYLTLADQYVCADQSLYVLLQAVDAFTPTSGGKINITLSSLIVS
jgi:hypothetical protein